MDNDKMSDADWRSILLDEMENCETPPCSSSSNREILNSSLSSTSYGCRISSTVIDHFVEMGFREDLVIGALKETSCTSLVEVETVVQYLLKYAELEDTPPSTESDPQTAGSAYSRINCNDSEMYLSDDEKMLDEVIGLSLTLTTLVVAFIIIN